MIRIGKRRKVTVANEGGQQVDMVANTIRQVLVFLRYVQQVSRRWTRTQPCSALLPWQR